MPGPFTVAVTADGLPRHRLTARCRGLPAPAYAGEVPDVRRLGGAALNASGPAAWRESPNGRADLGAVELEKFVVLVTAEASGRVKEPSGRIVLRGQSPSTRLFPPDLLEFSIGRMGSRSERGESHHGHAASSADSGPARWTTVPMPPGLPMLPAEMALRPEVAPFLPPGPAPPARPREIVRLEPATRCGSRPAWCSGASRAPVHHVRLQRAVSRPADRGGARAEITVVVHQPARQPTTVHWHGIRLDHRSDGVPDLSQPAVPPGGHFTYRLRFPDAGIYWYHPHVREDIQQELGLYGNMLVRSGAGDDYGPANREEVLMLDDLLIDDDGLVPLGRESPTHALMGRFGNLFLVNGEPGYRLNVERGEVVRFFLTNVSNTRTFNLSFPGARMKVVASDVGTVRAGGVGRERRDRARGAVRRARALRAAGDDRAGQSRSRARSPLRPVLRRDGHAGDGARRPGPDRARPREELRGSPARPGGAAEMEHFRRAAAGAPDKALVLTLETQALPPVTQQLMQLDSIYFAPMEWSGTMPMMNWASTGRQVRWIVRDPATGKENMDVDWRFRRGGRCGSAW